MSQNQFKVGDLVELISGSPKMVIFEQLKNGMVTCLWFNTVTGKIETSPLPDYSLKVYKVKSRVTMM